MSSLFVLHRSNMQFIREDESVDSIFYRHIFFFIKKIFPIALSFIALTTIVISFFYYANIIPESYRHILIIVISIVSAFLYLMLVLKTTRVWMDYKFDNLIITSKRVLFIDRHFLKGRTVIEIPLEKVIGVKSQCTNIVANILGYAILEIDSAVDNQHIIFEYAPNVRNIKVALDKVKTKLMNSKTIVHHAGKYEDSNIEEKLNSLIKKEMKIKKEIEDLKNEIEANKNIQNV